MFYHYPFMLHAYTVVEKQVVYLEGNSKNIQLSDIQEMEHKGRGKVAGMASLFDRFPLKILLIYLKGRIERGKDRSSVSDAFPRLH